MPADVRMQSPPSQSMALPVFQGVPYGYQLTPVPITMQGSVPVAMCNSCTSSWFPPPLPPVPNELRARLDILEQQVGSPQAASPRRIVVKPFEAQVADVSLSKELREELGQAQEGERQLREEMRQQRQAALEESRRLKKDIQKLQAERDAEQHAREDLEFQHQAVLDDAARLRTDFQRAEEARDSEARARVDVDRKHQEVELDTKRLYAAQADSELSKSLRAELWQAQEAERQTREDLERRHQDVVTENSRLKVDFQKFQSDMQRAEATVGSEKQARESIEQKHREAETSNKKLQADLAHWQHRHGAAESDTGRVKSEVSTLRAEIDRMRSALAASEFQVQEKVAENERLLSKSRDRSNTTDVVVLERTYEDKISLLSRQLQTAEASKEQLRSDCGQLRSDLQHLEKAKHMREESEQNLRTSLENERNVSRELRVHFEQLEDDNLMLQSQGSGGNEMVNEVRRKLQAAEATIDQQRSSVELLRRRLDVVQGERDMLEARLKVSSNNVEYHRTVGFDMDANETRQTRQRSSTMESENASIYGSRDMRRRSTAMTGRASMTSLEGFLVEDDEGYTMRPSLVGQVLHPDLLRAQRKSVVPARIEVAISSGDESDMLEVDMTEGGRAYD